MNELERGNGETDIDKEDTNGVDSARRTDDAFNSRRDFIGRRVSEDRHGGGAASDGS